MFSRHVNWSMFLILFCHSCLNIVVGASYYKLRELIHSWFPYSRFILDGVIPGERLSGQRKQHWEASKTSSPWWLCGVPAHLHRWSRDDLGVGPTVLCAQERGSFLWVMKSQKEFPPGSDMVRLAFRKIVLVALEKVKMGKWNRRISSLT